MLFLYYTSHIIENSFLDEHAPDSPIYIILHSCTLAALLLPSCIYYDGQGPEWAI